MIADNAVTLERKIDNPLLRRAYRKTMFCTSLGFDATVYVSKLSDSAGSRCFISNSGRAALRAARIADV
jgi:hypothetical protein